MIDNPQSYSVHAYQTLVIHRERTAAARAQDSNRYNTPPRDERHTFITQDLTGVYFKDIRFETTLTGDDFRWLISLLPHLQA